MLIANRWRRFGHDRLYLSDDRRQIGWMDLQTGDMHPVLQEDLGALRQAAEHWRASEMPDTPMEPRRPPDYLADAHAHVADPAAAPAPTAPNAAPATRGAAGADLADRRPGQGARERAREEWDRARDAGRARAWLDRLRDAKTDERAWRVGAGGEETVGRLLEKLTKRGFRVLHSIPVSATGGDIDHLLVGPTGVFTINTKNHPDKKVWVAGNTLMVSGTRMPYIHVAAHEAGLARRVLGCHLSWDPAVTAVIVVLTGSSKSRVHVCRPAGSGVEVIGRDRVPRWFRSRESVLSQEHVEEVYAVARRPETWLA